jgi:hypothetical protein
MAYAQSTAGSDDLICAEISDAQEVDRCFEDRDCLRELDQVKDQRIQNLEKELDLQKRENELKDRIIAIKGMEIQAQKRAFEDMKEVSDRAIKLAETSKPKLSGPILTAISVVVGAINTTTTGWKKLTVSFRRGDDTSYNISTRYWVQQPGIIIFWFSSPSQKILFRLGFCRLTNDAFFDIEIIDIIYFKSLQSYQWRGVIEGERLLKIHHTIILLIEQCFQIQ